MLKERRSAAESVAKQLFEAEEASDIALAAVASLAVTMPQARKGARLSVMYGQDAFEGASQTLALLTQARRTIIDTHNALSVAQTQMGLGRVAFGPNDDKPDSGVPITGIHLTSVKVA